MIRKSSLLTFCLLATLLFAYRLADAQSFSVFSISDISRVYEDGFRLPPASDTISLFGIRGEIISGQFAVNSKTKLSNITVEISRLTGSRGEEILSSNIDWNFVGSVLLPSNAPNQPEDAVERIAPAKFPDYLMQERKIDLERRKYQPVWLTLRIPSDASQGKYSGSATVICDQGTVSIPLRLSVYGLTLPEERHLKIAVRFNVSNFDKYHGIKEKYSDEWFRMLGKYAENMVIHRQNVMQAPLNSISISRKESGNLEFDFSLFDRIVDVFMNTGRMDFIETGYGLTRFGKNDWFSTEIELNDFTVLDRGKGLNITLPGSEVVPSLLPAFEKHLREKGWLGKTLLSVKNEPSVHNAVAYCDLSDYFHWLAPGLKQFESIETTMYGGLDIPGPKLDHLATWYDKYREDMENGKEICYYIVGIYQGSRFPDKTIDVPLMDSRVMPWLNYKYNLSGIKHWGWNSWTDDPYTTVGQHLGDGWHVYPLKNGILNSLRWEEMRDGIQDYECFRLLEDKVRMLKDSLGSGFSWIDPRQRGVEITGRVVKSFAEFSVDPADLYLAKKLLINEILDFDITPGVYVQTNPPEGSVFTSGSSVEVFGWAEPGTKITVNRREIPVSEEGLFLEQFGLSLKNSRITVIAEKNGKTKTMVREFKIHTTDRLTE